MMNVILNNGTVREHWHKADGGSLQSKQKVIVWCPRAMCHKPISGSSKRNFQFVTRSLPTGQARAGEAAFEFSATRG